MEFQNRLYELLELGEYDIPTFRERMEAVKGKIAALERKETETRRTIDHAKTADPQAPGSADQSRPGCLREQRQCPAQRTPQIRDRSGVVLQSQKDKAQ